MAISASRATVLRYRNAGIDLEFGNAKTLVSNLKRARNNLPTSFFSPNYTAALTKAINELQKRLEDDFSPEESLTLGIEQGHTTAKDIFTGANFAVWRPPIPLNALTQFNNRFATDIRKVTNELKTNILGIVQNGLVMGTPLQDVKESILGVGLKGLNGRDGVFRRASFRAETIARSITNDAVNYGAHYTYLQMEDITPEAGFSKSWSTTSDNRTSGRCNSLNGQTRKLNEEFESSDGWKGQRPSAHPNCRSRIILIAERYKPEWDLRYVS